MRKINLMLMAVMAVIVISSFIFACSPIGDPCTQDADCCQQLECTDNVCGGIHFGNEGDYCDDGNDNDGDGLVDCADSDCATYPTCEDPGPAYDNPCDYVECGDGYCAEECDEDCLSCSADCGACPEADPCESADCGDGICQDECNETCETCEQDCGPCAGPCDSVDCGDGICNDQCDEDCWNCPGDCGVCPEDICAEEFCGNGNCEPDCEEHCDTCPEDCGECPEGDPCATSFCGDQMCLPECDEDCMNCPGDCGECPEENITCENYNCTEGFKSYMTQDAWNDLMASDPNCWDIECQYTNIVVCSLSANVNGSCCYEPSTKYFVAPDFECEKNPNGCTNSIDCDDGNICTTDMCENTKCKHTWDPNCIPDSPTNNGSTYQTCADVDCWASAQNLVLPDVWNAVMASDQNCWNVTCDDTYASQGYGVWCGFSVTWGGACCYEPLKEKFAFPDYKCDNATGCTKDSECDDGNVCTTETCTPNGVCQYKIDPNCNPNNPGNNGGSNTGTNNGGTNTGTNNGGTPSSTNGGTTGTNGDTNGGTTQSGTQNSPTPYSGGASNDLGPFVSVFGFMSFEWLWILLIILSLIAAWLWRRHKLDENKRIKEKKVEIYKLLPLTVLIIPLLVSYFIAFWLGLIIVILEIILRLTILRRIKGWDDRESKSTTPSNKVTTKVTTKPKKKVSSKKVSKKKPKRKSKKRK